MNISPSPAPTLYLLLNFPGSALCLLSVFVNSLRAGTVCLASVIVYKLNLLSRICSLFSSSINIALLSVMLIFCRPETVQLLTLHFVLLSILSDSQRLIDCAVTTALGIGLQREQSRTIAEHVGYRHTQLLFLKF